MFTRADEGGLERISEILQRLGVCMHTQPQPQPPTKPEKQKGGKSCEVEPLFPMK